jgi:branched-chain amino acid transport system substrate-binding protein
MKVLKTLAGLACGLAVAGAAFAADPVKIGLILPMSGPFAAYGKQIEHGVKLYLAQHGDTSAGRKVEMILKDDNPGTSGDIDKRLAQELVVKDKVDILAGFGLTPSAFAVAPVATEAKKPMVVMNAATSAITTKSPYIIRTSMTLPQNTAPVASWAAKNGIKKVFTLVADYGPGHDSEAQFKKTFTAAGGEIVGEVRVPVKNPDFAPFLQKIKDTKPDAVFLFLPPGAETIAFMKGFSERGLEQAGIRLISTGDLPDEDILEATGDSALAGDLAHYSERTSREPGLRRRVLQGPYRRTAELCRSAATTACT